MDEVPTGKAATEPVDRIRADLEEISEDRAAIRAALGSPTPDRLLKIAQAMRHGLADEQIFEACKIKCPGCKF